VQWVFIDNYSVEQKVINCLKHIIQSMYQNSSKRVSDYL